MVQEKGHLIEQQVLRWISEQQGIAERERGRAAAGRGPARPIITVSRQHGTGGADLARRLAERLGFQLFDREVIDVVAHETGVQRELLEALDERARSWVEQWVDGVLHSRILTGEDFVRTLGRILISVARMGSAVVVGRGANFILAGEPGFHIRLVAGFDHRVARIMQRDGVARAEAEERITVMDRQRAEYLRRYLHRDIDDATAYHVVLNLERVPAEAALDSLVALYERSLPKA